MFQLKNVVEEFVFFEVRMENSLRKDDFIGNVKIPCKEIPPAVVSSTYNIFDKNGLCSGQISIELSCVRKISGGSSLFVSESPESASDIALTSTSSNLEVPCATCCSNSPMAMPSNTNELPYYLQSTDLFTQKAKITVSTQESNQMSIINQDRTETFLQQALEQSPIYSAPQPHCASACPMASNEATVNVTQLSLLDRAPVKLSQVQTSSCNRQPMEQYSSCGQARQSVESSNGFSLASAPSPVRVRGGRVDPKHDYLSNYSTSGYTLPPANSQSSANPQSPAYTLPPAYTQSPAYTLPPAYTQSPAYTLPPAYSQPPAYTLPPAYPQQSVYSQASAPYGAPSSGPVPIMYAPRPKNKI